MPTYDYRCETCGLDFEVYQSFTDDSIPKCPGREAGTCKSRGKGKVTKVLSAPAITFKGSGFYKNDSRGSSKSSGSSSESGDSSSSSDSKSSSSDSSSDTKSSSSDSTSSSSSSSDSKSSSSKSSSSKKSDKSKTSAKAD